MEQESAIKALGALAQTHRMRVFRLLVRTGEGGMAAGDIARALGLAPSSLSFHLNQLEAAGLLRARRAERHIFYAVDMAAVRALLAFLLEDCCQGAPQACAPLLDQALSTC
ncbi:MAG: transcriptional regulator [Alphaproteobacteria bacterium]|nr:MAG: transcriptional regulator [Alphaproteobacteria bacterium]